MVQRRFATAAGEVVLSGDFSPASALVVVIRGAYANEDQLSRLPAYVQVPVVFGDIPGNRSPWLPEQTLEACAAAYSAAIDELERPTVVCGVSLGGLIALGMRSNRLRGVVAIDPPLLPAETDHMRKAAATAFSKATSEAERAFLFRTFGARVEGIERRDHFPLLEGSSVPLHVLAAELAAPNSVPSVVSDDTLRRLTAYPHVSANRIVGVGHAVWRSGSNEIVQAITTLLAGAGDQDVDTSRSTASAR